MSFWRRSPLIDEQLAQELRRLLGSRVVFDAPMSKHTSLRVGGPADALAYPQSRAELVEIAALCRTAGAPLRVLGGGFNVLVLDTGLRGVLVQLRELRTLHRHGDGQIFAEAGVTHSTISRLCAREGLTGLEFAVGIPGTVGGWMRMNAGIPGREMKDVVEEVEYLDLDGDTIQTTPASQLSWQYRRLELPAHACVLAARFATEPGDPEAIRRQTAEHLARRRATQPIDHPSCGSVFKNPPGDYAGRLIEAAGLKGAVAGGAQISELHANFIVTRRGALAGDVLTLIEHARSEVRRRFSIELETEVQVMGEA